MQITAIVGAVLAQASPTDKPYQSGMWGYVISGWTLGIVGIGAYAGVLIQRGRRLAKQVRPDDRRYLSS